MFLVNGRGSVYNVVKPSMQLYFAIIKTMRFYAGPCVLQITIIICKNRRCLDTSE